MSIGWSAQKEYLRTQAPGAADPGRILYSYLWITAWHTGVTPASRTLCPVIKAAHISWCVCTSTPTSRTCARAGSYRLLTGFKLLLHDPELPLLQQLPPGLTVLQVSVHCHCQGVWVWRACGSTSFLWPLQQ